MKEPNGQQLLQHNIIYIKLEKTEDLQHLQKKDYNEEKINLEQMCLKPCTSP